MAKQVVVLLHGVGSNGDDLQTLAYNHKYWCRSGVEVY